MSDYNKYVTAINKIFDYLAKMKAGWNGLDNRNYIESIEEYKGSVTQVAELIKNNNVAMENEKVESLEND